MHQGFTIILFTQNFVCCSVCAWSNDIITLLLSPCFWPQVWHKEKNKQWLPGGLDEWPVYAPAVAHWAPFLCLCVLFNDGWSRLYSLLSHDQSLADVCQVNDMSFFHPSGSPRASLSLSVLLQLSLSTSPSSLFLAFLWSRSFLTLLHATLPPSVYLSPLISFSEMLPAFLFSQYCCSLCVSVCVCASNLRFCGNWSVCVCIILVGEPVRFYVCVFRRELFTGNCFPVLMLTNPWPDRFLSATLSPALWLYCCFYKYCVMCCVCM